MVIIYRLRGEDFRGNHLIIGTKKGGSGVIGNNADAKLFGGKQGIFWECESSELLLGSKFVPKNSPTVEFDTLVFRHSNTLLKIWLREIKWPTTFLNVSTENFREQRGTIVQHYLFRCSVTPWKSRGPFNFSPDFPQSVWMVNNRSVEFHCGTAVFLDGGFPTETCSWFHFFQAEAFLQSHLWYHFQVFAAVFR